MIELAVALLAIPVLLALTNWRQGLLLCVVTGILQDPFRKITPDQPVFFVTFVGVVFAAACVAAVVSGAPLTPGSVVGRDRSVRTPMTLLLLLIVLQAFNSFVRFDNPAITLIGLLTYLLPLPSFIFAYQLVLRGGEDCIRKFISVYLVLTVFALATVYLDYVGVDWSVLGQVGGKLLIFDKETGKVVTPHSGIYRSAEIAAWHAATAACFALMLATWKRIDIRNLCAALIAMLLLVGIAALTGRRKAVVEVAVFASTYLILWVFFQKGLAKIAIPAAIAGLLGFGWIVAELGSDPVDQVIGKPSRYDIYVERSKAVFADVPDRFIELGIAPVMWAYDKYGLVGAGLGSGTQGTQYFGRAAGVAGVAEGGLGKIAIELGFPGLFVVGWLAVSVIRRLWRTMWASSRLSPRLARLSYALVSFLVANVAAFSVATQAYGDLYILLILSWTLGFLWAIPVLLEREARARQPAILKELAPLNRLKPV